MGIMGSLRAVVVTEALRLGWSLWKRNVEQEALESDQNGDLLWLYPMTAEAESDQALVHAWPFEPLAAASVLQRLCVLERSPCGLPWTRPFDLYSWWGVHSCDWALLLS